MKNSTYKKNIFFIALLIFPLITYFLSNVLIPFFIGLIIAYILDPFVDYLESKKIGRGLASSTCLIIFLAFIFFILFLIFPIFTLQLKKLLQQFPDIISSIENKINYLINYLKNKVPFFSSIEVLKNIRLEYDNILSQILDKVLVSSYAIVNWLSIIVITPFVSWYLLKDYNKILAKIKKEIPKKGKTKFLKIMNEIDLIFSSYLRGQLSICIILGIYYSICFYIVKLDYSLFIGIFSGFLSFIPVIGIILSFFLTTTLTLMQFLNPIYIIFISIIFIIAQILEGNYLTPKLIGKKLGLHPLVVILSLVIFGEIFGLWGIIFAVPCTCILKVIYKSIFPSLK
tara:strand:- start:166 stop:1191 length:1026 start_codon:yes stop_codon:yes gene_type:complete